MGRQGLSRDNTVRTPTPFRRAIRSCYQCGFALSASTPPIQGGVSARNYWIARWLAAQGHSVDVVTNAAEVESGYRIRLLQGDTEWLTPRFERGGVRIWGTEPHGPRSQHIPDHNPFVTKLTSLAITAIETASTDVVLGIYLEPYALAAYLAATLTNRPLILRHAGSDVGRLLQQPQLGPCYEQVLRNADLVCGSPSTLEHFSRIGVSTEHLYPDPGFAVPQEVFHPNVMPIDINRLLAALANDSGVPATGPFAPINRALPTIGIYGKVGISKGSYDLVGALGNLKERGRRFNFLTMCGGSPTEMTRFSEAIVRAGIEAETRHLPFLAHWRVPSFLRALTAACFLENRFPIAAHAPGIPQEVLMVGVPLITTAEIARKQSFAPALVHGHNILIVRDPRDHAELAGVLDRAIAGGDDLAALGDEGRRCVNPEGVEGCLARYEATLEHALVIRQRRTDPHRHAPIAPILAKQDASAWRSFPASRRLFWTIAKRIEALEPDRDAYLQALRLCSACAEHWHALSASLPPYTGEVLRFELHQVPDPDKIDAADTLLFRAPVADPESVIMTARNVTLRAFDHDMDALIHVLLDDQEAPAIWPHKPKYYVFQHLPGRSRNRVIRVSSTIYQLLTSIDGNSGINQLLRRVNAQNNLNSSTASQGALSTLLREGIIIAPPVSAVGSS
nr:glycosyltransferase [Rhodococcus sp. 105337]